MFGLFSPSTLVIIGFYIYVVVAIMKRERGTGATWGKALGVGLVWPATIWKAF